MSKQPIEVAAEIARLESLTTETLREEWRRLNQTPPPKRLSRELLLRGITYAMQEAAFGGLSKRTLRRLEPTARAGFGPRFFYSRPGRRRQVIFRDLAVTMAPKRSSSANCTTILAIKRAASGPLSPC